MHSKAAHRDGLSCPGARSAPRYAFANAITRGEPLTVYNGGAMARDFTYIDDIVDGILKALGASVSVGKRLGALAVSALTCCSLSDVLRRCAQSGGRPTAGHRCLTSATLAP